MCGLVCLCIVVYGLLWYLLSCMVCCSLVWLYYSKCSILWVKHGRVAALWLNKHNLRKYVAIPYRVQPKNRWCCRIRSVTNPARKRQAKQEETEPCKSPCLSPLQTEIVMLQSAEWCCLKNGPAEFQCCTTSWIGWTLYSYQMQSLLLFCMRNNKKITFITYN